jgi:hypothetical protein
MTSRRGRRWTAIGAALCVLLAAAGAVYRRETVFDARREALTDVPFDLLVQPGISDAETAAVRDGLRAADRHLRTVLDAGVTDRVEVRMARTQGCGPLASPAGPPTGWAEARLLCPNTRAPAWRSQFTRDPALIAGLAAHEHVHNAQAQLGCLRGRDDHEWLWLFEGMAVHLAFQAMVTAGRWPDSTAIVQMRDWGLADAGPRPLSTYERSGAGAGDPAYALFHLATRHLDAQAPRPSALMDFCRAVGTGSPWRTAFTGAFGISVDDFYASFEAARPALTTGG